MVNTEADKVGAADAELEGLNENEQPRTMQMPRGDETGRVNKCFMVLMLILNVSILVCFAASRSDKQQFEALDAKIGKMNEFEAEITRTMRGVRLDVKALREQEAEINLDLKALREQPVLDRLGPATTNRPVLARPAMTRDRLRAAENKFKGSNSLEADHGDIGGDRMTIHGYAQIYSKYLPVIETVASPTIAEIGILTCTGVAMWTDLFPGSKVFGFDINTASCLDNFDYLQTRGFNSSLVKITTMDQNADNAGLLGSLFGKHTPLNLVIDDGYHVPQANVRTFAQIFPFLADRFVYIIEDVYPEHVENTKNWSDIWAQLEEICPPTECSLHLENPVDYEEHAKPEYLVVITRS